MVAFACTDVFSAADNNPVRQPSEDVDSPELRRKAGLQPNENLLFNGWGVAPAGDQVPVSDMALKLVVAPDKRRLVAVSGGFSNHGVTLLDMANRKVAQFLSLTQSWNGLAFSKEGSRFFVSGGASGFMHVYKYANGEAAPERCDRREAIFQCRRSANDLWWKNVRVVEPMEQGHDGGSNGGAARQVRFAWDLISGRRK